MNPKKKRILAAGIAAVILIVGVFCLVRGARHDAPVKVILDCDMGYMNDDALSLSMLLQAEKRGLVEVLGITLEGGNNFIDAPYENYGETQFGSAKHTEDFLAALDRTDIPFYRGTDLPSGIKREGMRALGDFYNSLTYCKFDADYGALHSFDSVDVKQLCDCGDAADFLLRSVRENPDEVVLFVIGPSMNVAKAVQQDADFAPHVKAVYFMGGALGDTCRMENSRSEMVEGIDGANTTPYAEYNVFYDPVAFATCLAAPFPRRVILPGSCNIPIDRSVADSFIARSDGNKISQLWAEHWKDTLQDYPFWDPMTVYSFLCPEAVTRSAVQYVTVNTDRNSEFFGQTEGYDSEEYEKLSPEEQARCGLAEVIFETEGFWDYTIDLLCS